MKVPRILPGSRTARDNTNGSLLPGEPKRKGIAVMNAGVTVQMEDGRVWHKASASSTWGQCIEVAATATGVAVRDSKDPDGPILVYAPTVFKAFLDGTRNGKLTL